MPDLSQLAWNLADVWETVAGILPDAPAQVCGQRRFTWAEFDRRSNGLAAALLDDVASPDDRVAMYLRNCPEYIEGTHAALKIGIPSVNTNYRYASEELRYLWEDADVTTVVFHGSYTERIGELRHQVPRVRRWLHVDDGAGECPDWALPYEQVVAGGSADPVHAPWGRNADDLLLLYTGGTTGMPKGVMWRSVDFLQQVNEVGAISYPLEEGVAGIRERLREPGRRHISASPYMHGSGLFGALITMHQGGCVVSLSSPGFDAAELLDAIDRYHVSSVSISSDIFGQRILAALAAHPGRWDGSSMRELLNAGAVVSEATKRGLVGHWPQVSILDGFSSSEGFGLGWSVATRDSIPRTGHFTPGPNTIVVGEDGQRAEPGSAAPGLLAVRGRVPLGYYKDRAKSATTFVDIDGERYAVPGDRAILEADGSIQIVGRDSLCINSAGEKIFTEEVEAAIVDLGGVTDVLVVGIPDPQWGQAVAAVVSVEPGKEVSGTDVVAQVKSRLAAFKAPKHVTFVDIVPRGPNGKADYPAVRQLAEEDRARSAGDVVAADPRP
jgi:fatty-acyl-CoA synthase